MRGACAVAMVVALAAQNALAQERTRKLTQLSEIGPSIYRCWRPPSGTAGDEITVVFSFNRKGEVFGKPRVSHSQLTGSADLQKDFVASVFGAITSCTPLPISDSLGGSLAGRPFAMRFVSTAKRVGI